MNKQKKIAPRDGYGLGLVEAAKLNKNIVVLCCDLTESTRSHWFKKKFPKRFIEVGVAEQNMIGIASGLSQVNKVPFCSSYAVFNPGRNWDQIRVSVCYSNANVKIAGAHAGLSVGQDGATHQALEDIALLRTLPNITIVAPCDALEAQKATVALANHIGPAYIRFGKEKTPIVTTEKSPFIIGKANVLKKGNKLTIVACGSLIYEALLAAKKIDAEVINCHTVKPLDIKTIIKSAKKTGKVITIEEHQVNGGLGSAVAEALSENYPIAMHRMGVLDVFGQSASPQELIKKHKLTSLDIINTYKNLSKQNTNKKS